MKLAHESSRSVSPAHSPVPEKSPARSPVAEKPVKSVDDKAKVLKILRDNEQKHHDLEHAASITANLARLEVMRANEQRIRADQLHQARLLDQEHLVSVNANLIKMRQQNGFKESPQDRAHTNSLDAKLVDIRAQQTMIEPSSRVNNGQDSRTKSGTAAQGTSVKQAIASDPAADLVRFMNSSAGDQCYADLTRKEGKQSVMASITQDVIIDINVAVTQAFCQAEDEFFQRYVHEFRNGTQDIAMAVPEWHKAMGDTV
jgi:hypothetical protein